MHLFETDPSGALIEYKATAVGRGRDVVFDILEKEYSETLTIEDAIKLGAKALEFDDVDVAVVGSDKIYRKITPEKIAEIMKERGKVGE